MLVQTATTLYDVDLAGRAYREVAHDAANRVLGPWLPFDRMSPVTAGAPLRFFVVIEDAHSSLHYRVVRTEPVTRVLAA